MWCDSVELEYLLVAQYDIDLKILLYYCWEQVYEILHDKIFIVCFKCCLKK